MAPWELSQMTWKEVLIRLYGIEKRKIEERRNVRTIAYSIHVHSVESKHRLTIYDFMPLQGDPSKEVLKELRKQQEEREANEIIAAYEHAMKIGNIINAKA